MNLTHGIHHKRTGLDYAIIAVQVAICAVVIGTVAFYFADAWVREDMARVAKLHEKFYGVTEQRTYAIPNPHDLATPRTRVFAEGRGR